MAQQETRPSGTRRPRPRPGGGSMKRVVVLAGVTLGSLLLTGCTPPAAAPTGTPMGSLRAGTAHTPSTLTGGVDDGPAGPVPSPADSAGQKAAVSLAEKFMTAFARSTIDAQTWINGLYPMLTQQAAAAYEGTDPANVPVHQVTGAGSVVEGSTDYALLVRVPTDIGVYAVSLTRQAPADLWLVERITPPGR